ncbi:helix-turn-helix transcriptional regulator [Streptomyces sp. NPDC001795]|uniref:helix-turn-helix domain-containing protein n=1 Tax=Streptomyces sp. NPDC001795 TaxID=3154525 RepID=UPI003329DC47
MTSPRPAAGPRLPFARLAEHLVALRTGARMSQRDLALAAAVSRGTVQRAESGTAAPSTAVLDALVRACGGDRAARDRALVLRNQGRTERRGRLRGLEAPAPALIHTEQDLGAALAAEYERAGAPSPGDLVRPAGGRTPIPRTTAWRIIKRKGLPADADQLQTFLDVCRVRPSAQRHYREAFQRIRAARSRRTAPPPPRAAAGPGRGTAKISPWFKDLMDTMSPDDIETALTVGTAYLIAGEAHRNGTAPPRSLDHVMRTARELFADLNSLPPALQGPDSIGVFGPRGDLVVVETKSSRLQRGGPITVRKDSHVLRGAPAVWQVKNTPPAEAARTA